MIRHNWLNVLSWHRPSWSHLNLPFAPLGTPWEATNNMARWYDQIRRSLRVSIVSTYAIVSEQFLSYSVKLSCFCREKKIRTVEHILRRMQQNTLRSVSASKVSNRRIGEVHCITCSLIPILIVHAWRSRVPPSATNRDPSPMWDVKVVFCAILFLRHIGPRRHFYSSRFVVLVFCRWRIPHSRAVWVVLQMESALYRKRCGPVPCSQPYENITIRYRFYNRFSIQVWSTYYSGHLWCTND